MPHIALTKAQILRVVIFLKEAAAQIDNARLVAHSAADRQTEGRLAALLRDVASEITHLEILRQNAP
jgi:hypothetical protein